MTKLQPILDRLILAANNMNIDTQTGNREDYEFNQYILNYVISFAAEEGVTCRVFWGENGRIKGVQVGSLSAQAMYYEE